MARQCEGVDWRRMERPSNGRAPRGSDMRRQSGEVESIARALIRVDVRCRGMARTGAARTGNRPAMICRAAARQGLVMIREGIEQIRQAEAKHGEAQTGEGMA